MNLLLLVTGVQQLSVAFHSHNYLIFYKMKLKNSFSHLLGSSLHNPFTYYCALYQALASPSSYVWLGWLALESKFLLDSQLQKRFLWWIISGGGASQLIIFLSFALLSEEEKSFKHLFSHCQVSPFPWYRFFQKCCVSWRISGCLEV